MRRTLPDQLDLVPAFHTHVRSRELAAMSEILDAHPEAARWVLGDLVGARSSQKGREGMSGEQVLRVMLVKQLGTFSYEELAFHLADSASYRAFCRIGSMQRLPTPKTLQRNIKKVEPSTLERINVLLIEHAIAAEIEDGNQLRVDCTVVETNIHDPTDSSLLVDSVRVLVRLMDRAQEYVDAPFTNHHRRAKRRGIGILHARTQDDRLPLYQDLLKVTNKTVTAADRVLAAFASTYSHAELTAPLIFELVDSLQRYLALARRVVTQTHRRVVLGETVPASEKLVSIFETHTDIIVKDRRDTLYGHKLCLATGASGLITDCHVQKGNPADSTLAVGMVERHMERYGHAPQQVCFDGAFASRANFDEIKRLEAGDVVFTKGKAITVDEMAGDEKTFRRLRRFRAGIEATISFLKRCVGWTRCTWRSLRSFTAYTWASVVTANLLQLARHALS
ncbi:MAG: ISNCY family transposase [Proteobacteria bacterium]|nr:MAG: ISNCY family transposase [Pseudomonadota bacterium]